MKKPSFLTSGHEVRTTRAQFDECRFVFCVLNAARHPGVMIDVGAHYGGSLKAFAQAQWIIYAFEPDPKNRAHLVKNFVEDANVHISGNAVSDCISQNVAFFGSEVSTGISGLSAFHDSHFESARVDTTTLNTVIEEERIQQIDFLKIDVEGFEMSVLEGLTFDKVKPRAIIAEFEDNKTEPQGYKAQDLINKLTRQGYVVYVSEWHPIERYGIRHSWKQLRRYPTEVPGDAWGNLVAFLDAPDNDTITTAFFEALTDGAAHQPIRSGSEEAIQEIASTSTAAMTVETIGIQPAPTKYYRVAQYINLNHPILARCLRFGLWSLRTIKRRVIGFSSLVMAALTGLGVVAWLRPDMWLAWSIAVVIFFGGIILFLALGYIRHLLAAQFRHRDDEVRRLRAKLDQTITREATRQEKIRLAQEKLLHNTAGNQAKDHAKLEAVGKALDSIARIQARDSATLVRLMEDFIKSIQRAEAEAVMIAANDRSVQVTLEENKKAIVALTASATSEQARYSRLSVANAPQIRPHVRLLSTESNQRLIEKWVPAFNLKMTRSQLSYLAHKICVLEDAAEGRLAAPIETMLMRLLASHSLVGDKLDILEIGTLFGVSAGAIHSLRAPAERKIQLTLLDPMDGYYDTDPRDPVTGAEVKEPLLLRNLARFGVPSDEWRLIKHLSTDDDALKEASDRQYDMIIVDGDHTLKGITRDYELYGNLVKPNGLLIFDDYDTQDWPEIKPYVDATVIPDKRWIWVGADYRTGILKRAARQSPADKRRDDE